MNNDSIYIQSKEDKSLILHTDLFCVLPRSGGDVCTAGQASLLSGL